ncbi:MAG: FAD-binding oxidoreductase [Gammaproteobacteria bacterium]
MPLIRYEGKAYQPLPGESVLDCLLRHDVPVNYSCRSGICQTCLMRVTQGEPEADTQKGLKESLKKHNYFMPCVCYAKSDLEVTLAEPDVPYRTHVIVKSKDALNRDTVKVLVEPQGEFAYLAGQFINLCREDGLIRSYSLASVPQRDDLLEFHVRKLEGGQMSSWVHDEMAVGTSVRIEGPIGDCVYVDSRSEQNLLLVGTGCGLSPLWGILNTALEAGHHGQIYLFHGSYSADGLYLVNELNELAKRHPNFHYRACIDEGEVNAGYSIGRAHDVALAELSDLKSWRVFLCGHPEMVSAMKKRSYLAGVSLNEIHSDPFLLNSSCTPRPQEAGRKQVTAPQ